MIQLFAQFMMSLFVFVAVSKVLFLALDLFRLKPTKGQYEAWKKERDNG